MLGDLVEIVVYVADFGIIVVFEIELFGYIGALLVVYFEYGVLVGAPWEVVFVLVVFIYFDYF